MDDSYAKEIDDTETEATGRALLVLKVEVDEMHEKVERVKIQVDALAKRHGIEV